jgi:hypothetical protein
MAAILVYGTGISSFLFKYFVLFHHPTGATDHVSENDLQGESKKTDTFDIQMNNKGVSFFLLTLYSELKMYDTAGSTTRLRKKENCKTKNCE